MSDRRAELRRQWRQDAKQLRRSLSFRDWLRVFDTVKKAVLLKENEDA